MDPLASSIHIPIVPSAAVTWLVYGGHALLAFIILTAFPVNGYTVAAAIGVSISLVLQHASRVDLCARIDAVLLSSANQWSVLTRDGEVLPARLAAGVFVSPGCVILPLKPAGQRLVHVILTRDNTPADTLRRLRVRLRVPM